ncbi:ribbon-helix-helix domain-containing protein [Myxococcota bacterium]|nr:ribbon-helix-helix domain-containing protein [Myxococcota bacterium]
MELSHKTTILLPPDLHRHIVSLARQQGVSMGELIRRAVQDRYGRGATLRDRLAAVEALGRLDAPVGEPAEMKRE